MCEIIDDCDLNASKTGDCVDKVNGYTCDCDEDHELILQVACVERNVKNFLLQQFQIEGVNRPKSTARAFDRGCVFVAARSIMVARAHT